MSMEGNFGKDPMSDDEIRARVEIGQQEEGVKSLEKDMSEWLKSLSPEDREAWKAKMKKNRETR